MKCKIGDWVRFQRAGSLVIGRVNYRRRQNTADPELVEMLVTDAGDIPEAWVLECRPEKKNRESK